MVMSKPAEVYCLCLQLRNLQHLGISYNRLETIDEIGEAAEIIGELRSLDIGFNSLCDHAGTMLAIQKVLALIILFTPFSPLVLIC